MVKPTFNPMGDILSGIIMAATSVPQLIAYAETVGYASYRGLSTAGPPLLAWGLVTGSPYMNAGVTSITALMAKSDLSGDAYVAQHGQASYVKLVAAYSLYIAVASILLAVLGFGRLAKQVPKTVRSGFKWGCSVGVLVAAVPNGFYANGGKQIKELVQQQSAISDFVAPWKSSMPGLMNVINLFYAMLHPWTWSIQPALLFVLGTAFVMNGSQLLPKSFPPGTEVILLTAAATWYSLRMNYEGAIVGEIPAMDPDAGLSLFGGHLKLPIELVDVPSLVTEVPLVEQFGGSWLLLALSATIFAGVNFLSIMGIAGIFEGEDGIPWNAERELLSQAVSCVVAAAVGSAPVSGSLSRSLVARMTGATSQLACIVTALCWIYLQPYMSIMTPTPKAALSAVIVSAVLKGIILPIDLLNMSGIDAVIGWGTGIATSLTSPTQGFGIGLVLFAILSLVKSKQPKKKIA